MAIAEARGSEAGLVLASIWLRVQSEETGSEWRRFILYILNMHMSGRCTTEGADPTKFDVLTSLRLSRRTLRLTSAQCALIVIVGVRHELCAVSTRLDSLPTDSMGR